MAERVSEEVRRLLDGGLTAAHLARLFKMDPRTVRTRLANVRHCAQRGGQYYYWLFDAAPELCAPPADIVERVLRMQHMDLPPMLRKEYWTGQQAKLRVEQMEGELWPTEKVVDYVGSAFKDIRMSILLVTDSLERETTLSDRQRETIRGFLDGLLEQIVDRLKGTFADKRAEEEVEEGGDESQLTLEQHIADL